MSVTVPLLCFNDVYRVNQRFVPQPGSPPEDSSASSSKSISVSQFGSVLLGEREKWRNRTPRDGDPGDKDGLVLFAGDVFNPSVESSVTRGSHMVPVMNAMKLDAACVGNHDFDFGYPHLTTLIGSTNFPWLLSNIIDSKTNAQPEPLLKYLVVERCGAKIGIIGLVEEDWIGTIPSWPQNFAYRPMKDTAVEISKELRDPNGCHKVDIIIALTHCRVPNDIKLANDLGAVAGKLGVEMEHGVDLLIGGHDHIYYIGKGAEAWEGHPGDRGVAGTEGDNGVRIIKSGTDFRDLSSATLTLSAPNEKAIRRRTITSLKGKHHYILPSTPSSIPIENLLKTLLQSVSDTISRPVCFTLTPFDARSEIVRTKETGLGNWVADVLMHAYAESLMESGRGNGKKVERNDYADKDGKDQIREKEMREMKGGADAVIICGGTIRGDSQYGPGKITLGDILEILPFEDPVVCIEIDGRGIWDTLESALSRWPSQEGRFPIVSGLAVKWDHTLPPNQRVKSINLVMPRKGDDDGLDHPEDLVDFVDQEDGTRVEVKQRKMVLGDEVKNEAGGRIYRIITREYMAQGYDGFDALKNRKYIVDDENGQIMSSIIRSFLLGSAYIFRHKQLFDAHEHHLSSRTDRVLSRARAQHQSSPMASLSSSPAQPRYTLPPGSPPSSGALDHILEGSPMMSPVSERSFSGWGKRHIVQHDWATIRDALHIAKHEHMSLVDVCVGNEMRGTSQRTKSTALNSVGGRPKIPNRTSSSQPFSFLVDEDKRDELRDLGDDLAIVSPLVDGRMRDLGEKR